MIMLIKNCHFPSGLIGMRLFVHTWSVKVSLSVY